MPALLAAAPLLVVFLLLVLLKWPAKRTMPVGLALTAMVAYFYWQAPALTIAAASLKGLVIAGELLYIVWGALLLLFVTVAQADEEPAVAEVEEPPAPLSASFHTEFAAAVGRAFSRRPSLRGSVP